VLRRVEREAGVAETVLRRLRDGGGEEGLVAVGRDLVRFADQPPMSVRATLNHGDVFSMGSLTCSIALDRDDQFFATAGTSRRVKVFELSRVLDPGAYMHFPVAEVVSRSKLSSVCWNAYIKTHLAVANYDGAVQLHDVASQREICMFEEHHQRVWSVDCCVPDPFLLASGGDDGAVKVWSLREPAAVTTLQLASNVCHVQFSPRSPRLLAAGCADGRALVYDLRNSSEPLAVLSGHSRAVSFCKFLSPTSLFTASVDSTLKSWDLAALPGEPPAGEGGPAPAQRAAVLLPQQTYASHVNRTNFVGLATSSDGLVFTGSEDNCVYGYQPALPVPVLSAELGRTPEVAGGSGKVFVSALAWSDQRKMLLAANSCGVVQVLSEDL